MIGKYPLIRDRREYVAQKTLRCVLALSFFVRLSLDNKRLLTYLLTFLVF